MRKTFHQPARARAISRRQPVVPWPIIVIGLMAAALWVAHLPSFQ